jgi:hypothetical protein
VENKDCVWDDGVAPELALDFDAPNISSREALWTMIGVFSIFVFYYNVVIRAMLPSNPALEHATDVRAPDYSAAWKVEKK